MAGSFCATARPLAPVRGGVASNDGHRWGAALYGLAGESVDFLVSANRDDNGDYKAGDGTRQTHSGSTQCAAVWVSSTGVTAPGHRLTMGYQAVQDEGSRYLRPNFWQGQGNSLMPQKTMRDTLTVTLPRRHAHLSAMELGLFDHDEGHAHHDGRAAAVQQAAGLSVRRRDRLQRAEPESRHPRGGRHRALRTEHPSLRDERRSCSPASPHPPATGAKKAARVKGLFAEGSIPLGDQFLLGHGRALRLVRLHRQPRAAHLQPRLEPQHVSDLDGDRRAERARVRRHPARRGAQGGVLCGQHPLAERPRTAARKGPQRRAGRELQRGPVERQSHRVPPADPRNFISTTTGATWAVANVGTMKSSGYEVGVVWNRVWRSGLVVASASPQLNGYDLGDEAYGLGVSTGRSWNLNLGYRIPAWNLDLEWFGRFVESKTSTEYLISEGRTAAKRKPGFGVHDVYVNWPALRQRPHARDLRRAQPVQQVLLRPRQLRLLRECRWRHQWPGFAEPGRNVRLDVRRGSSDGQSPREVLTRGTGQVRLSVRNTLYWRLWRIPLIL